MALEIGVTRGEDLSMRSLILAFAAAAALVACGQQVDEKIEEPPPSFEDQGYTVILERPDQLILPQSSPISISQSEQGLLLRGHVNNPSSQLRTDGASIALGPQNEQAFAGRRVRVTFYVRGIEGATEFESAYSTNGDGNSGWRQLEVSEDTREVSYLFNVPLVSVPRDDYIGINPPASGAIEIQRILLEVLPVETAAPEDLRQ